MGDGGFFISRSFSHYWRADAAGVLADAVGVRPMLVVAAMTFALVASGLAVTPFRNVRARVVS